MSLPNEHYLALLEQLQEGKLSPQDTEILITWLGGKPANEAATRLLLAKLQQPVAQDQWSPEVIDALEARLGVILQQTIQQPAPVVRFKNNSWLRYAAVVMVCAGMAAYLYFAGMHPFRRSNTPPVAGTGIDIAPGRQGAILTLADGSTVLLDSLQNGLLATQGGSKISLNNGRLIYHAFTPTRQEVAYNTLTTPKGRQFEMILPDGTKVWLNAASSLRYPAFFSGKERTVEITGEAYFEVAQNRHMPFRVKVNKQTAIEVLGTHFNIHSYKNETFIQATLLEGAINIVHQQEHVLLQPGQQAQVTGSQNSYPPPAALPAIKVVKNINLEKVMAWKNGLFNFQDATLEEVMHQLERWYDIEVVYQKGIPPMEFVGKMDRGLSLSAVLHGLEMSQVHFRLEVGRKLVVLP